MMANDQVMQQGPCDHLAGGNRVFARTLPAMMNMNIWVFVLTVLAAALAPTVVVPMFLIV